MRSKQRASAAVVPGSQSGTAAKACAKPAPIMPSDPDVFSMVKADLDQRNLIGIKAHWKALVHTADKDWLVELYEELLDACVYLRALLEVRHHERKG